MIRVDYDTPTKYRTVSNKIMDIEQAIYFLSLYGNEEDKTLRINRMYLDGEEIKLQLTFNKTNYVIAYGDKLNLIRANKTQVSDKCEITLEQIEDGSFLSVFDPILSKSNVTDLKTKSYTVVSTLFNELQLGRMEDHLRLIDLKKANIVKGDSSYRTDNTHWLDTGNKFEAYLLERFNRLRKELNETCILNLKDVESHFAHYTVNAKYGRHLDALKENNKRKVSAVTYLNRYWKESYGGYLRLYVNGEVVDIEPKFPSTVLFMSEEIEHEVLETYNNRLSIATWFRD